MNEKTLWITKCALLLLYVAFTLTPQSAAATAAQPSSPSGRHTDQGKCQEQLPQGKCQETGEQQRQCEGLARALANEWMRSTVVTTNISGIHYENITRASSTAWSDITPRAGHAGRRSTVRQLGLLSRDQGFAPGGERVADWSGGKLSFR